MAAIETESYCIATENTSGEDRSIENSFKTEKSDDCGEPDDKSHSKLNSPKHSEGDDINVLPLELKCLDPLKTEVKTNEVTEPIPGSSDENCKDGDDKDWTPSSKVTDDSKHPESEDNEDSEEELGEEERLEEESDAEMDEESNGGAYHLAEVSYGEENEDSQKAEGVQSSNSTLGISKDHYKSAVISKNIVPMNIPSDLDETSNDKHVKKLEFEEGSHVFVHTVILKKIVSYVDVKGDTKNIKHFKCKHCNYSSREKHKVVEHTYKHQGLKPYRCPECSLSFGYVSYLREHRRITHLKTPFDCKLCGRKCGKQSALDKHLRVHTGEKPFACNYCDYRSTQQNHIKVHMRQHTGEKPYTCKLCDYKCAYSALLKRHLVGHTGEKTFSCSLCDYIGKTKESLQAHLKRHSNEKPFSCVHCTKSFHTRDAVKRHIKNIHLHNQFKCENCDMTFKREITFKMHMDEHSDGVKRYTCSLCEYKCAYKLMLNKHMLSHTAGNSLVEPMMSTVVSDMSGNPSKSLALLNDHQSEETSFSCSHCPKTFQSKLSLKNHTRYMHFPNQYICNMCNLSFKRRISLQLHMTEHLKMFTSNTKGLSENSN